MREQQPDEVTDNDEVTNNSVTARRSIFAEIARAIVDSQRHDPARAWDLCLPTPVHSDDPMPTHPNVTRVGEDHR